MLQHFGAKAPRPVLHPVNQAQGDLTRLPAFPNPNAPSRADPTTSQAKYEKDNGAGTDAAYLASTAAERETAAATQNNHKANGQHEAQNILLSRETADSSALGKATDPIERRKKRTISFKIILTVSMFSIIAAVIVLPKSGVLTSSTGLPLQIAPTTTRGIPVLSSTTCHFTSGPRAGQTQYFGPARPGVTNAAIGGGCTDGVGDNGYAIPDQPNPPL
jgi:hypothetical protein